MHALLMVALLAQVVGMRGYTFEYVDWPGQMMLATKEGQFAIAPGEGCDEVASWTVVEVLPGSGGVAALAPLDSDVVCNVYIEGKVTDDPCRQIDGECDPMGDQ
jgi:hypothetical protein